ncbi:AraC family transcriptional regulator [Phototrophicus methaneseepsis]|uniref:AraC family transcriptional regulator n=1 Tax=Phototrophicus methaneseepsis TaxID=2710758 RepID=A0A7S8IFB1_9CHLR|nr:AraC family transcriptional regulator [Phototrophicus methaneseepsis]QPC84555.1 AraC family transcriptional regulator [Phototrophicus methaneseepsis]
MRYQKSKLDELTELILQYAPEEGVNATHIDQLSTAKISSPLKRRPGLDIPIIAVVAQGRKQSYVADQVFDYQAGHVIVICCPIPVEIEIVEDPLLLVGISVNLSRLTDVLLRLDRLDGGVARPEQVDLSSMFSIPLTDDFLNPFIRLLKTLGDTRDADMLSNSIIDEIYYRLLSDERGQQLRSLLVQNGEIQRISRVVEYIHRNLDQPVSVDQLAGMAHMSRTVFYETFKNVMHLSPLQYAKSVKLYEAQKLIKEGKRANEAAYRVGYNSPVQFSREYKRYFGYSPSATPL